MGIENTKYALKKILKLFIPVRQRILLRKILGCYKEPLETFSYADWIKRFDILTEDKRQKLKQEMQNFPSTPLISIIVPYTEVSLFIIKKLIQNLKLQCYPRWELILINHNSFKQALCRICLTSSYNEIKVVTVSSQNLSEKLNQGLEKANGEVVIFMDVRDQLASRALYEVVAQLNQNANLDIIYSDSDYIDEKSRRYDPYFKPDWDPYLILGQNYVFPSCWMRKCLIEEVGGFRADFAANPYWDLVLRLFEKTDKILHIPHVLYHQYKCKKDLYPPVSICKETLLAGQSAVAMHLERKNIAANVSLLENLPYHRIHFRLPKTLPLVSIIIPTKDKVELLKAAIDSIFAKTPLDLFEIIIMNNNDHGNPHMDEYLAMIESEKIKVVDYPHPFNFALVNNIAVKEHIKGEILVCMNDDVEAIDDNWFTEMLSLVLQKNVGIVGSKLYFPDNTIQHAGGVLGMGSGAAHIFLAASGNAIGYFGNLQLLRSSCFVTAACVMIKRSVFEAVGGFDAVNFQVNFNDPDLCLRIRELGYLTLWTPHAKLYHKESATLGKVNQNNPERLKRFKKELVCMQERWKHIINDDPYYNPNLSLTSDKYQLAFPPRQRSK